MIMRLPLASALLCIAAATTGGAAQLAHPELDFKGKLYRSVFAPGPDTLSSGDIAQAPDTLRGRLSHYLILRANFASKYESAPNDIVAAGRDAKRRVVERAIATLIEGPDIPDRAVAFVRDAPIAYEWERRPDGPLAEAAFAENVLATDKATPLAPYLYVFIAQRARAAFEAAEQSSQPDVMKASAAKYRENIANARKVQDPIFGLLADDLERVEFVYMKATVHPKDYK
jgi:hypothetical protein